MTAITILGGTGYTGANLLREAAARGHDVTSYSRSLPTDPVDGVRYETGSLLDAAVRERAIAGADVVFGALSPRGELTGRIGEVYAAIGLLAAASGARFGVVGGFGSLRPAAGAPRFAEGDGMPAEYAEESRELLGVLTHLLSAAPDALDWVYVSPAAGYGSYAAGEATGVYRLGGDVALFDAEGNSALSGADLALAVVDEIETPAHHREQISIAY